MFHFSGSDGSISQSDRVMQIYTNTLSNKIFVVQPRKTHGYPRPPSSPDGRTEYERSVNDKTTDCILLCFSLVSSGEERRYELRAVPLIIPAEEGQPGVEAHCPSRTLHAAALNHTVIFHHVFSCFYLCYSS